MSFEENEVSQNANGGTEITKRKLAENLDQDLLEHFQIVPSRVRELKEDKIRIYWAHDLASDPECEFMRDSNFRDKFHLLVFSSNWQYQQFQDYYGIPYNRKSVVLETWIDPVTDDVKLSNKPKDVINIFYGSTPHRGLVLLVPVFRKLIEEDKNIHLHVHSSFELYGWKQQDEQFNQLFDEVRNLPQATYYGYTERSDYLKKINDYHILAYPSIWKETSCRVLMEAMSAGCFCVHPNYGALPDTSGGLNWMYTGDMTNPNVHASLFYNELKMSIKMLRDAPSEMEQRLMFNKHYIDTRFNFAHICVKWNAVLKQLLNEYPTVESRKYPSEQFIYRVN